MNNAPFTVSDIRSLFGQDAHVPDYFASVGVSTDSRTVQPGNIFVALRGERFDAHENMGDAILKGAVCMLFERRWLEEWEKRFSTEYPSFPHVVVENSLHALGVLAAYHRNRYRIPVVAVAGAAGKTSTKDLTAHVLAQRFRTLRTEANYNNQVGTPHTLLGITKFYQAAVIEIGTNEPGEIELLSAMTHPTHGIITNIGKEHLEKLIDLDGVEREETALFQQLEQQGGVALVNMDDERLAKYAGENRLNTTLISFSAQHSNADVYADIQFDSALHPVMDIRYKGQSCHAHLQTVGYASALNALCAAAIAYSVGLSSAEIQQGLESYLPPPAHGYARMLAEAIGGYTVLNDCYNANPESMYIALKTLAAFPTTGRRLALLGDMRELGDATQAEHRSLLEYASAQVDELWIVGNAMKEAYQTSTNLPNTVHCVQKSEAAEAVAVVLKPGDVLLVKASRGIALESVIQELREEVEKHA